ncbi:signal transduction histidine kinase/ligand-binding sensor domain-containing protein/CheY-like chemotaxis protein/AraC-like DNA-binding protein [Catalinimonas alkaloidigena]|uniref:hybrid sensor histidine kinase/response regulator transcription factor n=1 Tax=Catalinimonas alkaloidigena TaxID=1075417 RepID=UPI002406F7CA|nr:two-component regulator propeller domain-containing protein [Catalinimonas alkaloidigena]MDF9795620.1 signal transduction histidine kinase/ligand-binding sensor domain-containing protein/CheY-like chemotaxis protein/AraC-like DNA-binding protein [Catalinimonas alkaloidigena]
MIRLSSALFVIFFFNCLFNTTLTAQKLSFEAFTAEDGLSKNYIGSITQDNYGFVWIASSHGLNRYDGYSFRSYYHYPLDSSSLSHSSINTVFTDSNGQLWVGTALGLNLYDPTLDKFERIQELADRQIFTIYEDTQGVLWVGTDQGVFVYQKKSFQFLASTQDFHIRKMIKLKGEKLLLATDAGLFTASANESDIHQVAALEGVHYISDLLIFQEKLWVSTREEGIYTLDTENLSIYTHLAHAPEDPRSLNANDVLCMLSTSDENLWVGTDLGGLHLLDSTGTGFIHYTSDSRAENSLSSNNILTLFEDKDENLWIGTNYGGLNFSAKDEFFHYYKSNPYHYRSSSVHAILQDSKERLWVGSGGNGLTVMSQDGKLLATYSREAEKKKYRLEGNTIQTLAEDHQGRIWVGMYERGINVIEPGRGVIKTFRARADGGLQHDDVRNILIDEQARIWIATKGGGLHTYSPDHKDIVPVNLLGSDTQQTEMLIWLYEGDDGNLWLGNYEGKAYFITPDRTSKEYQLQPAPWSALPSFVTALQEDQHGNYWIGTWNDGVYYWDTQQSHLKHYEQHKGLKDTKIRAVLGSEAADLWISTSSGLAKYHAESDTFKWFDNSSSLRYTDFLFGASFQSADGTFFFGGGQGLYAFQSEKKYEKTQTHAVFLNGLKIMGKQVEAGTTLLPQHIAFADSINLSHEHSVFTIDFVASQYPRAGQQQYVVKLEGFEDEWRNIGSETSATFTNIKPGKYLFRVRILGENTATEKQEASIKIIVHPPFWQTPAAFFLYCLALLFIIYLARRFTIARIQLKNDLIQERKEREREEETHQMKLNFFTGLSHEFRTPLMLIINPLEKLLKDKKSDALRVGRKEAVMMERNAKRLLRLINQLLTFRKLETSHDELHLAAYEVEPFIKHVFQYFDDLADREHIAFRYVIKAGLPQIYFDLEKMETVLYNLLSNAFKFTPADGSISVSVDTGYAGAAEEEALFIKVEDNGIGIPQHLQQYIFDRYYQVDEHHMNGNSGTGIGLALVKKIVEMHGGAVSVQSQEGRGSCFTVSLPLKKQPENTIDPQPEVMVDNNMPLLPVEAIFHADGELDSLEDNHKQSSLLLVDDNDEIRSYLKSAFYPVFSILEARNGQEALHLLSEHKPSLIISDVMMPEMDGISFCKKVKSNPDTHHIPLILLTARSGEESMLQALRAGADDYLEKPIQLEALQLKVKNTLAYREEVKKELSRDLIPDPQTETHQSSDQEFLEAAMQVVEQNIENAEFSVEGFAATMGVSKTHLYKKLKGLTGLSANEFTRSVRLKKATSLLKQERWSVSEVAYMVGFNNPNYFSKCFIREYGIAPSKFESPQHKLEDE